jgi:alkylation response protein AidB-like acyl-CoA dehydrogenase
MFCLCRTEPDAQKHAGISYLLIPMDQPGVEVRPLRQMTGGADFNEVFLTDARTGADHIVGKRGEGWNVSRATLKHERNSIGSSAQTAMMFKGLVHLAKTTQSGNRPNIKDPLIRDRLGRIEGRVKAHEYSGLRQLTKNAKGEDPGIIQMMNKLLSTDIGNEIAELALDLLGDEGLLDPPGSGATKGQPVGNRSWIGQYMYSLGIAVAGGTANIQRNVIAERGLGLPRDYYAERSSGK